MSTIRMAQTAVEKRKNARGGVLHRAFAKIVEARGRSVERIAAAYIARLSDQQLTALGFSNAEIASLRAGEPATGILVRR